MLSTNGSLLRAVPHTPLVPPSSYQKQMTWDVKESGPQVPLVAEGRVGGGADFKTRALRVLAARLWVC